MSDKNNPSMLERIMSVDGEELSWSGVLSVLEQMEKKIEEHIGDRTHLHYPTDVQEPSEECLCRKGIMAVGEPAIHTKEHCYSIESIRTQVLNEVIAKIRNQKRFMSDEYNEAIDDCITICNSLMK